MIGYIYGGSGTNFNVPDYQGLFLRGLATNTSNTNFIGDALGALQTDGIKNHQHTFTYDTTTRGGVHKVLQPRQSYQFSKQIQYT